MNMTEQRKDEKVALRAKDVSHSYGELEVLDSISVTFERGDVSALIGANGSGKTTFLRILAGLMPPDSGEVIVTAKEDTERRVGYLPQQPDFRSGFTVAETLRFYTRLLDGVEEGYVEDALKDIGLWEVRDRDVSELSGGMTRLLGIAQARVGDPPLVMLDEPTSGLDPKMTRRIFGALGELADDGAAVVLTTHDLERVRRDTDEAMLLHDGGIAVEGAPDSLVNEHGIEDLSDLFDEVGVEGVGVEGG